MNPDLAALLACSPLVAWFAYRIAAARRTPMPDLPDDIGVTPATGTRPAILWARYGNKICFHAVRHLPQADTEPADHEEPQP